MRRCWKAGIAIADITPPVGIDLAGYAAREQGSSRVHDNLYVKALVLDEGNRNLVILTCDLLGVDSGDVQYIRGRIEEKIGINSQNIMVAASHTHSGPATLHTNGIGIRDEAWIQLMLEKFVECAANAKKVLEPVSLRFAAGTAHIEMNRRGRIPEGSINPAKNPVGPVDREVLTVSIHRVKTGSPWIVLFNYGCHPTALGPENRLASADYPGAAMLFVGRKIAEAGLAWAMKLESDIKDANIPSKQTVQVQRVMLGGVALVAIPAEVFAETAMSIRRKSQGGAIVISYGNGDVGYLPTRGEIGKGGYEVLEAHKYYGYCSHFAPEAEENVRKAAIGLRKLK